MATGLRLALCCVIGVIAAAPSNRYKTIIIIMISADRYCSRPVLRSRFPNQVVASSCSNESLQAYRHCVYRPMDATREVFLRLWERGVTV